MRLANTHNSSSDPDNVEPTPYLFNPGWKLIVIEGLKV